MSGDPFGDVTDHCITTVHCRQRAYQRDPDLHCGQKAVGTRCQIERRPCRLISRLGQLPQSTSPTRNNGHLCPGKKSVGQNEYQDDQDFAEHEQSYPSSASGIPTDHGKVVAMDHLVVRAVTEHGCNLLRFESDDPVEFFNRIIHKPFGKLAAIGPCQ